jgi:hypothetical protein
VKDIADSGNSTSSDILAVVICALGVMLFVELPLIAMFVTPGNVSSDLERFNRWLKRNGRGGAGVDCGIYAIIKGIDTLT